MENGPPEPSKNSPYYTSFTAPGAERRKARFPALAPEMRPYYREK
jgi:hypothetical protein